MDLNLLTALDALLEANSVVGAAQRLHLTPPAVSRTLARIRYVTGDDIFVRAGRGLLPTPYALSIRDEVRHLMQQAESLLRPGRELDLATLDRVFTLRGHDVLLSALAPALIAHVGITAPHVRLRFLGEMAVEDHDTMRTEVDMELGASEPTLPEILHEAIGADRLVVACRRGHPLTRGTMSLQRLANSLHINVSRRGRLTDRIDDALAAAGLKRHVVASLPTCAAVLEVIARSDFVTILPGTLGAGLCRAFDTVSLPLPLEVPSTPVVLLWHRRFETDTAHAWMRGCIAATLDAALDSTASAHPALP